MQKRYPLHPACKIFPRLGDEELRELAENIRRKGLLEDIILLDGKILDGRNRDEACRIAEVEPRYVDWSGEGSPVEWVISKNLYRRHLTASQRAVVAHDLLPMLEKEAKERQRLSKGRGKKVRNNFRTFSQDGEATEVAARIAKSNSRYVKTVKAIAASAPEVVEKVRAGELTVADAEWVAKLPAGQRRKLFQQANGHGLTEDILRCWKVEYRAQLDRTVGTDGESSPAFVFRGGSPWKNPRPNNIATPPGICRFLHDLIAPHYRVKTILDPSAGAGALTKPWKGRRVIAYEILKNKDFFSCPNRISADLVLCNPPFNNGDGESRFLPQVFLERIVKVVSSSTPIVLFAPMALRLDQTKRSSRWRWLRDHCPPITSIITLPHDAFGSVKVHSEILLFNMPKLKPHYFLADKYLG